MSAAEVSAQRLGPVMHRGSPPTCMPDEPVPHSVIDQERSNITNMFTVLSEPLAVPVPHAASSSTMVDEPPVEEASTSMWPVLPVPPDDVPPEVVPPDVVPPEVVPPDVVPPLVAADEPPVPVVPPFAPDAGAAPKPKLGPVSTEGLHE